MAESTQPLQPPSSPAQASSHSLAGSASKDETPPQAIAKASTKYDVLPPPPQQLDASTQPASSSTPQAQPFMTTLTAPSTSNRVVSNAQELLASARAKIAATKNVIPPSAPTPSINTSFQKFEITHLKTIKCDVCQQKNGDILYKCQNCNTRHQICSRCVETTRPRPAKGILGRKDWSVHAKLKDAHADYMQPISLGKKEDGSYERDGVKFTVAQGKRGGLKKPRTPTPKRDRTPHERNATGRGGMGRGENTEHGRRIVEMARARLEKGQDPELKERIAAARARRDAQAAAEAGEKAQTQAQAVEKKKKKKKKKRKAAALDEDEDGGEDDNNKDDEDKEGDDKRGDDPEDGSGEVWDEVEIAGALLQSTVDKGLRRSGQSNRIRFQYTNHARSGTFSPARSNLPCFREGTTGADFSSAGQRPLLLPPSNQASINDPSAPQHASTRASRKSPIAHPRLSSSQPLRPRPRPSTYEMKITARRRKPTPREATGYLFVGSLDSRHEMDSTTGSSSSSNESSSDSIKEEDHPKYPHQTPDSGIPDRRSSPPYSPNAVQKAEQNRHRSSAQRELRHVREEEAQEEVEEEDPYAKDANGISLLLQAARMIEDRDRARIQERERNTQFDGSTAADMAGVLPELSDDGEDERFKDYSEFDWLSNTPPGVEKQTTSSRPSQPPAKLEPEPRGHTRRWNERRVSGSASASASAFTSTHPNPTLYHLPPTHQRSPKPTQTSPQLAHPSANPSASVMCHPNPGADIIVRQRIKAINDRASAASKGKLKRNWNPLVKEYIEDQRVKRRKTMEWLAQQGREGGAEKGEGIEAVINGGLWDESESSESVEEVSYEGESADEPEAGDEETEDWGGEGGDERARGKAVEILDSQDEDDDDDDDGDDLESDPISMGCGHRRAIEDEDSEDDTTIVESRPRVRRLFRGHRSPVNSEME